MSKYITYFLFHRSPQLRDFGFLKISQWVICGVLFVSFVFWARISLYSWPGTHSGGWPQTLRDFLASASWVLGWKMTTTTPCKTLDFKNVKILKNLFFFFFPEGSPRDHRCLNTLNSLLFWEGSPSTEWAASAGTHMRRPIDQPRHSWQSTW